MINQFWQIEHGRIVALRNDTWSFPTAAEIFRAEFGIGGESFVSKPSDSLKGISFSRFPASVAARIAEENGCLVIEIGVSLGGNFAAIATGVDQIINHGCWYPIRVQEINIATIWLESLGFDINARMVSIAALIRLRMSRDRPIQIIDEVGLSSFQLSERSGQLESIEDLNAQLYPYQQDGVRFLSMIVNEGIGCILADEMGLGKTLQIVALTQIEKNKGNPPILIIAPATLLENWRREFSHFAPKIKVNIHSGSKRAGLAHHFLEWDVTVVSYETAARDEFMFGEVEWHIVVLDEAQNIKNPDAERSRVIKSFRRRSSIAVTGTPVENQLTDLWSLSDFVVPGLLGSLHAFQRVVKDNLEDASNLASLVEPLILRRKVKDVASDLPEKIEIPQPLKMSFTQAQKYEAIRAETLSEFGTAGGLVSLSRLRSFCAHAEAGERDSGEIFQFEKYKRLTELLEEIFSNREKVLIFCSYLNATDALIAVCKKFNNIYFNFIDGRIKVSDRQPIVDNLFNHEGGGCLILNPKAAGTGLNITAANHVIHFNPEWNPALTDQASARAFRRKQTRPVTVHHLFYTNTVEEMIISRAAFKRSLAAEAVTGHEGQSDAISIANVLQISPFQSMDIVNDQ